MTGCEPARHMLSPRPIKRSLPRNETAHVFGKRKLIGDQLTLALKVVLRDHHIPRVADDVDYSRIARIEVLMALDDPRARRTHQVPITGHFRTRNHTVDVRKINLLVRAHQVGDQEPCPGIPRLRIGHKKCIVGEDGQVSTGSVQSKSPLCASYNALQHRSLLVLCLKTSYRPGPVSGALPLSSTGSGNLPASWSGRERSSIRTEPDSICVL